LNNSAFAVDQVTLKNLNEADLCNCCDDQHQEDSNDGKEKTFVVWAYGLLVICLYHCRNANTIGDNQQDINAEREPM